MWIFHTVLTAAAIVIVLLVGMAAHLIMLVIRLFDPEAALRFINGYIRGGLKVLWFVTGAKATIIGRENIPTDRAVLYVGNHRSLLDIVMAVMTIPVPVGFISKIELMKVPLLPILMRDINCLFLDRNDNRQGLKVILQAIEQVKGGQSMFVFPEGTRSKEEGKFLPFHAGSFKIATKAKAPVVPVSIVGTGDVLDDHFPKVKAAKVVVEFCEPIETADMGRDELKELPERVRDIIVGAYEKNRGLVFKG